LFSRDPRGGGLQRDGLDASPHLGNADSESHQHRKCDANRDRSLSAKAAKASPGVLEAITVCADMVMATGPCRILLLEFVSALRIKRLFVPI
jgi:hypothetical protein